MRSKREIEERLTKVVQYLEDADYENPSNEWAVFEADILEWVLGK